MKVLVTKKEYTKRVIDNIIFGSESNTVYGMVFEFDSNSDFKFSNIKVRKEENQTFVDVITSKEPDCYSKTISFIDEFSDSNVFICKLVDQSKISKEVPVNSINIAANKQIIDKNTELDYLIKDISFNTDFNLNESEKYYGIIVSCNSFSVPFVEIFNRPIFTGDTLDIYDIVQDKDGLVFDSNECEITITTRNYNTTIQKMKSDSIENIVNGYYSTSSFTRELFDWEDGEEGRKLKKYHCPINEIKYDYEKEKMTFKDHPILYLFGDNLYNLASLPLDDYIFNCDKDKDEYITEEFANHMSETYPNYRWRFTFIFEDTNDKTEYDISCKNIGSMYESIKPMYSKSHLRSIISGLYIDDVCIATSSKHYQYNDNGELIASKNYVSLYDNGEEITTHSLVDDANGCAVKFNSKAGIEYNIIFGTDLYSYSDNDYINTINNKDDNFRSVVLRRNEIMSRNMFGIPFTVSEDK